MDGCGGDRPADAIWSWAIGFTMRRALYSHWSCLALRPSSVGVARTEARHCDRGRRVVACVHRRRPPFGDAGPAIAGRTPGQRRRGVTSGVNLPQNHRVEFREVASAGSPNRSRMPPCWANQGQALGWPRKSRPALTGPARDGCGFSGRDGRCSRRGSNQRIAGHSEGWMFAEQVELPRGVGDTFRRDGLVVAENLSEVVRLECQGELHQCVGNVSGGLVGDRGAGPRCDIPDLARYHQPSETPARR